MNHPPNALISNLFVELQRRDQIICSAASRQLPLQLTRYGGSGWTTYRSRFVTCRADEGNIYIEEPHSEQPAEGPVLRVGEQIGVSFRRGRTKCLFSSVVTGYRPVLSDPEPNRTSVTIRWPENLQEMQRRAYTRVPPPAGQVIDVSYRPYEADSQRPAPFYQEPARTPSAQQSARVQQGVLENLSASGLSVLIDKTPQVKAGDIVVCTFRPRPGAEPLQLDARLRHVGRTKDDRWSLGFQFVGLETSTEGHCRLAQLATIVSGFRRSHLPPGRKSLTLS